MWECKFLWYLKFSLQYFKLTPCWLHNGSIYQALLKVILNHIRLRVFNFITNDTAATPNILCRKIWLVYRTWKLPRTSAFISTYLEYNVVFSYKVRLREVWELCRMIRNEIRTHVIAHVGQYVKFPPFRLQGLQSSLFQKL